ncbi:MAG: VWA domain-containing protein [Nitrospirota bacterium]
MKRLSLLLFLLLFLFTGLYAYDISAIETQGAQKASDSSADGFDIILLMDSSGSMKKTDPQNYRKPAAKLFISLLVENDRIGIISFGDSAKTLISLTQVTKKNLEKLFNAVDKITSNEFTTHIHEAIKKGFNELKSSQRKNRILILMSDGKLTLGSKEKEDAAFAEMSGLLPELAKSNIRLYSIAFTEKADVKLLEDIAKETGGFFKFAKTDKDIHVIFASIFEKIKTPDTIPLEGDTFNIDKDIQEAILFITKKLGTYTTIFEPSNVRHTPMKHGKNIEWYEEKVFDMITIKEPLVGRWRVKLSANEGNKIFVITDINLKTSFEKNFVNKGEKIKIDARLEREGDMLKEKDVLEQVSFFAGVTSPDGQITRLDLLDNGISEDDKPGDAVYSGEFVVKYPGEYTIKITAEGKTFKREKVFQFKAIEPPPLKKIEQKTVSEPAPVAGDSWQEVLIKFGLINVLLLIAITSALIFLVFMIYRSRKYKILYQNTLRDLKNFKKYIEESQVHKEQIESQTDSGLENGTESAEIVEKEEIGQVVQVQQEIESHEGLETLRLKEELQEKSRLLNEVQKQLENLEKEYLILYKRSQGQSADYP